MLVCPVQQKRAAAVTISIPTPSLHFLLNEASGNFLETIAGLDLTVTNAPGAASGIVSGCRTFASASAQYATRADDAAFQLASTETLGCWLYVVSNGTNQFILGRDIASAGVAPDYLLRYQNGTNSVEFAYRRGVSTFHGPITVIPTVSFSTWYCVAVKWDGTSLYYSVNGAAWAVGTAAANPPLSNASATPIIGANRGSGSPGVYFNGRMDMVTYWKGTLLTDAEIATFYNAGAGHEYFAGAWN